MEIVSLVLEDSWFWDPAVDNMRQYAGHLAKSSCQQEDWLQLRDQIFCDLLRPYEAWFSGINGKPTNGFVEAYHIVFPDQERMLAWRLAWS
jgi:hypothetical protein